MGFTSEECKGMANSNSITTLEINISIEILEQADSDQP